MRFQRVHMPSRQQRHAIIMFATTAVNTNQNHDALHVKIESPEIMESLGAALAKDSVPGDVIFLDGDLGAGKTCFSRGFVRERVQRPRLRVTSPTFLLSNTYFCPQDEVEVHHMDLYRLFTNSKEELEPLDLPRVMEECISIIEWPSRLTCYTDIIPSNRLELVFQIDEDTEIRYAQMRPFGYWAERLTKLKDAGSLDEFC